MGQKKLTYKEAYLRLQEILHLVEDDEQDVDTLSGLIKEASSLLKVCNDKLFVADEEIKKALEELNK